jgi:hypothetical protein
MLCCKVMSIIALKKPSDVMCSHAVPGKGCTIREQRPLCCRQFFCGWRLDPNIDALWKPDICGFVLSISSSYSALMLYVDTARPLAWRMQPYHGRLRQWAARAFEEDKRIVALVAGVATVVLPDRDVPLGMLGANDEIILSRNRTGYQAELRRRRQDSAASRSAP